MNIELERLVAALSSCEREETFTPPPVSDYVVKHIYEPFQRKEPILFEELNFEAFDGTDLWELEEWCTSMERAHDRLCELNKIFCAAVPISVAKRAFC